MTKSDQNLHKNKPNCTIIFIIFPGEHAFERPLACVRLISLFCSENLFLFGILPKYTLKRVNCNKFHIFHHCSKRVTTIKKVM